MTGRNAKGTAFEKTVGQFLINVNIHFPGDSAVLLLSINPGEMKTYPHKDPYTNVCNSFIHSAENWEQPKC